MKKQSQKKLSFQRETLAPLQPQVLDAVVGAQATVVSLPCTVTLVSKLVCPPTPR